MRNSNKLKMTMIMTMTKEIMPLGFNILIQPYNENPYMQFVSEGGLQLTNGEFSNPDNGEMEKLKSDIVCGLVLEVGSKCTEVQVGDEIFFHIATTKPVPFMNKGFLLGHEQGIMVLINEGLKERFKK